MSTPELFRSRLDQMIDLKHPLAVLATRLPWAAIAAAVAPKLAHQARPAKRVAGVDIAGTFEGEFGGGISAAGRPRFSRLLGIARHKVVSAAWRRGIAGKQTYAQEGKTLRRKAGGYAHAKQFKRLRKTVKRQRTILGVVMREVQRKQGADKAAVAVGGAPMHGASNPKAISDLTTLLERAERIRTQQRNTKNKLYALHARQVERISKGKARNPCEFGVKVSLVVTHKHGLMVGARSFPGNLSCRAAEGHVRSFGAHKRHRHH